MSHRYGRYRRNPGGMLVDLAKRAVPVLVGLYGTRFVANKLGAYVPGVSSLGAAQTPAIAIATVLLLNFATKKVAKLARYRSELMLGAGLAALDSLFQAFAPASVKAALGVGDVFDAGIGEYVEMGDYLAVGADPIDDDIAMSDYIAVGGDGVEEELGLEEELGAVEEELGNDLLGGVSSTSLMRTVPTRKFLSPVPSRSFTRQIPKAGGMYDRPGSIYQGIFRGGGTLG